MQKRELWLDILKVISIIAVITLHVIGNTINTFNLTNNTSYEIIKYLCYFSIPTFVMISGSLFLNKDIPIKKIFTKYLSKIFLVLIIFGLFYSLIEIYFTTKTLTLTSFTQSIKNIITGNLWAHMWYLYLVIALYLITPIIRTITKNANKEILKYSLIILYIFSLLIPELSNIFNLNIAFYIPISSAFLFYYLYGYYLTHQKTSSKYITTSYILGIISFLIIIYFAITNKHTEYLTYTSSLIFFIANALFLFFQTKNINLTSKLTKITNSISKCSLGIYIIHQLYINLIFKLIKFDIILKSPILGLISYTLIIFIISYLTIYLLKKIPIINKCLL